MDIRLHIPTLIRSLQTSLQLDGDLFDSCFRKHVSNIPFEQLLTDGIPISIQLSCISKSLEDVSRERGSNIAWNPVTKSLMDFITQICERDITTRLTAMSLGSAQNVPQSNPSQELPKTMGLEQCVRQAPSQTEVRGSYSMAVQNRRNPVKGQQFAKTNKKPARLVAPSGKPLLPPVGDKVMPPPRYFEDFISKSKAGVLYLYPNRCRAKACAYCEKLFRAMPGSKCSIQCYGNRSHNAVGLCNGHNVGWYPHVAAQVWKVHKRDHALGNLARFDAPRPLDQVHDGVSTPAMPEYESDCSFASSIDREYPDFAGAAKKRASSPERVLAVASKRTACTPLNIPDELASRIMCGDP